jgi:predicted RNase H-like nuclease
VTSDPRGGHGPALPYSLVAGVTPCRGGWLVANAKLQGSVFALEEPIRLPTFTEVMDQRPAHAVIALNAPVGYLNGAQAGGRTCDHEARLLLGRRGASVKSAPVRLESTRELDLRTDRLDAISRTLLPRYREVAREMAPFRQRTVYEVNPDLSFFELNGGTPMRWSKRSLKGVEERRSLLERRVQGVQRILNASIPGVFLSHLLDAAAIVWTARRVSTRASIRIPVDPEWDDQGLRMELFR